jgi:peptidoglycan/xylan/chitin deacetylase (PgdA/CDA1 family)
MSTPSGPRIVVFTGDLNFAVRKAIVELNARIPGTEWLVVEYVRRRTLSGVVRNQINSTRRNGWRWLPAQAGETLHSVLNPAERPIHAESGSVAYRRDTLAGWRNFSLVQTADLHSATTLRRISGFSADVGLALSAPILRESAFSLPRMGTLNLHKGRLPDYRGMPPAFWEMKNREATVGCSVHWVTADLDAGDLVETGVEEIDRYSTVKGMQLRLDEKGIELLCRAVPRVLGGDLSASRQRAGGKTFRRPTLQDIATLNRQVRKSHALQSRPLYGATKDLAFGAARMAYKSVLSRIVRPRITVLLYHRVTDAVRDNLTVGLEQFDRQMDILRRTCNVMSMTEVLESSRIGRSGAPAVCVTFDDGYLDNYLHAAPIMLRHGIPGAFFVTTGFVGSSDQRLPHDVRRGNPAIPAMSWSNLRDMRKVGFTIGSHTVSHIDCAAETEETVRRELKQSRQSLERELGLESVIFAYPYGGRHHMTSERLRLVREAGYSGCLSAYGGTNIGGVDRFNVLRCGVHWEFSDAAFRFLCTGLRS